MANQNKLSRHIYGKSMWVSVCKNIVYEEITVNLNVTKSGSKEVLNEKCRGLRKDIKLSYITKRGHKSFQNLSPVYEIILSINVAVHLFGCTTF